MATLTQTGNWVNSDGLVVKFGRSEAVLGLGGEYAGGDFGSRHCLEFKVGLEVVAASTDKYILSETMAVPAGAFIEEIHVYVVEETAGVNANLNLGLIDQDRSTEIDFDGLLAAWDEGTDGTDVGEYHKIIKGSTEAGALVGTRITNAGLVVAWYDTAAYTDGTLVIRIFYTPMIATVSVY